MCGIGALITILRGHPGLRDIIAKGIAESISPRGPDDSDTLDISSVDSVAATLFASVLHMRGAIHTHQPVYDDVGNIFCWNGEVFGGLEVAAGSSDTDAVLRVINSCDGDHKAITAALGNILGPWAFIYYHAASQRLYYGRDPVGRRSLLFALPSEQNGMCFILSSVAPAIPTATGDMDDVEAIYPFQELVPSGVYCIDIAAFGVTAEAGTFTVQHEAWPTTIPRLVGQKCTGYIPHTEPIEQEAVPTISDAELGVCATELLSRLSESVRVRVQNIPEQFATVPRPLLPTAAVLFTTGTEPPVTQAIESVDMLQLPPNARDYAAGMAEMTGAQVAVLFSGGLDSMVLAALAHHHAPKSYPIDLINVCFAKNHDSPDRLAAIAGVHDLRSLFPDRSWQLICVDETYENAFSNQHNLAHLLAPCLTHMDFNIGSALWFASRGVGYVDVQHDEHGFALSSPPMKSSKALRYGSCLPESSTKTRHNLSDYDALPAEAGSAAASDPHGAVADAVPEEEINASLRPRFDEHVHSAISDLDRVAALPPACVALLRRYDDAVTPAPCVDDGSIRGRFEESKIQSTVLVEPHGVMRPETASVIATSGKAMKQKGCCGKPEGLAECTALAHRKCARKMCRPCCMGAVSGKACSVHRVPAAIGGNEISAIVSPPVEVAPVTTVDRVLCRSSARVLLLGIGADEQMGGYARHRTTFAHGAWQRLREELDHDSSRIWKRNLGRDDRVCSDHGREVRLPYLDEAVSALVRLLPTVFIADLRLPYGIGDKRILRTVARLLGLTAASTLVKRAIHFGSRIAKQSNVSSFGSNRAGKGDAKFLFAKGGEDD